MKRLVATITLIMLLVVELMTPMTYAVEEFSETETIEDVVEEVIEETESVENEEKNEEINEEEITDDENIDEEVEDTDDQEEGDEEEITEESEESEDDLTENEDIEESEIDENSDDGTTEEESVEEIDYDKLRKESRVAVLAEKLGIDWENEKDYYAQLAGVEGEYKGTRWQNETIRVYLIEHLEEILKSKTTTGDKQEESILTGLSLEEVNQLTGEIIDEIEGSNESIELNSEAITGTKTYDDVTVNVVAPVGSFYSGTTLEIEPIKWFSLRSLKNQLVEDQEQITEDSTVVAFNISFIYSGEEVQPLSGKTVSVTFNYEDNEDLKQAEEDESQEIKIYHINDKDEEGNKLDEKEVEKIDIIENNEGEIVVEAESFSIYTIVTQVAEEGLLAENENQLANFVYGEISFEDPNNPGHGITIMDRNLGAITTGAGVTASTGSYGYHYQWGNNYGFDSSKDVSEIVTSNVKVDVSGLTGYYSGTFIISNKTGEPAKHDTWMLQNNNNLWNGNQIQGPCPSGWHIPSNEEWTQLMSYWAIVTDTTTGYQNGNVKCLNLQKINYDFANSFYLPCAGKRDFNGTNQEVGSSIYYWTHSLDNNSTYGVIPYSLLIYNNETYVRHADGYVRGLSVRCFKDTYSGIGDMFTITYDFNGGSGSVINQMVKSGDIAERPIDPIKSGYDFKGWYISGTNTLYDFSKKVTEDKELYAKYKQICSEGFVDDGEQCIDENNIAYLKNGKNFRLVLTTLADGNPINYIKKTDNIIPDSTSTGNLSLSGMPVIAWYTLTEDGTGIIYYKTEASTIFMNGDSSDMFRDLSKLKEIDLSNFNTKNVTRMDGMFRECSNLVEIDLSNFNTKNVTRMDGMFYNCRSLTSLDVSKFDTSNVRDMSRIFSNCRSLTSLDVSKFDTSNVTDMSRMFNYCNSLTSLDVSRFDTSDVTNMSYMFSYMSLETIDVSKFDTSNVENMGKMFEGNSKLTMIDISNWDTSSVTDMNSMFQQANKLRTIYVSDKFSTQLVVKSGNMFRASSNLIGGNGTKYNSSHLDATYATIDSSDNQGYFTDPNNFTVRYLSGDEVVANLTGSLGGNAPKITGDGRSYTYYSDSNKTIPYDFEQTLSGYTEIYVDWVELKANIKVGSTFRNIIKGIANNNLSNIYHFERTYSITDEIKATATQIQTDNSETEIYAWFEPDVNSGTVYYYSDAKTIYLNGDIGGMFTDWINLRELDLSNFDSSGVTSMSAMFRGSYRLQELNLSSFNTSNLTSMYEMFKGCSSLKELDLSNFNTSNVTTFESTFNGCSSLTNLNISGFDTSKSTMMYGMFNGCGKLTELDVSHFNTSKVTNMQNMFGGCGSLTGLDLSSFDTSKVTNMGGMFYNMGKLKSLDLSHFVTSGVTNMISMFHGCSSLQELNLSSFDTSKVTDMYELFKGCSGLKKLNISNFNTANVTNMSYMFWRCNSLTELDLHSFVTTKVTNMSNMFNGASKLISLDVSNFDTSNTTNMGSMFGDLHNITGIDLSNFNTSKVTDLGGMFYNMSNLEGLDLSNFDTSKVTNMYEMFKGTTRLKTIYVGPNFITGGVSNSADMFRGANSLIGGNGTEKGNIIDKTYAKIDNESQSGYFTDPSHFKVNFISTTGVIIDSQWLSGGDTITQLVDNTKDYIYYKTYTDSINNELFDTGSQLYSYTDIYVESINKYKVEFDTMGGVPLVETQRITGGGTATGIEESLLPHKKKYIFEGWYETGATESFKFENTPITEDKILYAKWKEKICVTYAINGENVTVTGLNPDEDCKEDLVIPNKIEEKWVKTISNMAFQNKGLSGTLTFQTPSEITYIGYSAFRENNLTGNLILPEGLTSIQNHTFYGNNFNGELEIPSGVTSIGETSFYKNKFSGITLNEGLQSIGYGAFDNMGTLQGNLKIPSTVTSIASTAFSTAFDKNYPNNTLELGRNIKSIGYGAFRNNNISGSLILPEGLTTIENHTFYGNKFNGTIYIPSGINRIGDTAFYENNLSKVVFYTGGTINIGTYAFCNNSGTVQGYRNGAILNPENPSCMSLEDYLELKITFDSQDEGSGTWETMVNYGDTVNNPKIISGDNILVWHETGTTEPFDFENTPIKDDITLYGERDEYGVENVCFKTVNLGNGNISINGFKDDAPEECKINLVIPNRIIGEGWVTRIGNEAFKNKGLTGTLTFQAPSEILSINYMAFYGNTFAGELILPERLTTIGEHAFRENKFNGKLVIPSGITKIPYYSFYENKFTSIDFNGAKITSIETNAFTNMKTLSGELVIPDSVTYIGDSAFKASFTGENENALKLGSGIVTIGDQAFWGNNFVGELVLPESLISFKTHAFRENKFYGELVIPSGVTEIPYYSFYDNRFTSINFNGAKITSIGGNAFANMRTLSGELVIPDSVTEIGSSAFNIAFSGLTVNTLKLGTGIITIKDQAFRGNNFTGELVLPENLTTIGDHAFRSNKFNGKLVVPSGVTNLPYYSFYSNNLSKVFFESGSVVSVGTNAFCSNSGLVQGYKNGAEVTIPNPNTSCIILNEKYPYNVSYVTYGGEPSEAEIVLYGDTITNTSPIKTGYDFKGWYLTGDIPFNNNIPITGDLTLYALFQKDIEFRLLGNGNKLLSGVEEFDNYIVTGTVFNNDYEYTFTFPEIQENEDTPIIIGYSTGVDIYTPIYYSGDTITLTGSKTFYAQTKEVYNKHKGTFTIGTGVDSLGEAYQQQVNIYCTPAPTYNGNRNDSCTIHSPIINLKSGYNSAKYYRGSNIYNQDTDILISNDQTFTAMGDLLTYNITYILNAGYLDNSKTTYTTEEGFSVSNPIRTGYEFNGWTGTNIINPTKNLEINTGTYGDLTLYANWIPNIYTILFTYSGNEIQQTINYDEEIELNENTFEKEGYTFSGWYDEENDTRYLDKQKIKNLTSNSGTVFTLTAEWNPNTYTIVFHSNTGDDEILSQSFTYNEGEKSLAKNMFINTGYVFKGWNTEKLGTGITYQDEQEVSNLTSVNNTTINLYAQWNRLINISFKDGDMVLSGYSIESGETIVLPDNPIKNGYTFSGWIGLPEDMIAGENDLEILADWNKVKDNDEPQQASAGGGRVIKGRANEQEHNSANEQVTTQAQEEKELDDLYIWAHNNRITTLPTRKQANLDGEVIRGHLAKMLVNYELYVEGKELPKEIPEYCKWNDSYTEWESEEIKDYAEKACALGIMGINMNKFLPNEKVTRAQFGTVLSRILWGSLYNTKNNENIPYYKKHLKALKENKIMEITDNPEKFIEIRKRVWLMLRRTKEIEK